MKRNRLTHKKAEMISCARKSNTSNPFIIYDFYEQLEKVYIALILCRKADTRLKLVK